MIFGEKLSPRDLLSRLTIAFTIRSVDRLERDLCQDLLSHSLPSRLIAVGTLQDCPGKKPSFEEKTRFRRELERDLYRIR